MKSVLILPKIKVENGNAISGLLYGFPSVTYFLGYVHAISRELHRWGEKVRLDGCAIICHDYQIHTHKLSNGDNVFALTRNPLTKEGKTPPFNEEGRLHMEVSLLIECYFTSWDSDLEPEEFKSQFEKHVSQVATTKRLAGGIVTEMKPAQFIELDETPEKRRRQLKKIARRWLPGFILKDRSQLLTERRCGNSLDSFLNFYALKFQSKKEPLKENEKEEKGVWKRILKPVGGWVVPIQCGYKAISPLYEKGRVACVRDRTVPFRFVEPVYGLGEWMGLHRISNLEEFMWQYRHENDFYLCKNN